MILKSGINSQLIFCRNSKIVTYLCKYDLLQVENLCASKGANFFSAKRVLRIDILSCKLEALDILHSNNLVTTWLLLVLVTT